jgi:hypothetical protein
LFHSIFRRIFPVSDSRFNSQPSLFPAEPLLCDTPAVTQQPESVPAPAGPDLASITPEPDSTLTPLSPSSQSAPAGPCPTVPQSQPFPSHPRSPAFPQPPISRGPGAPKGNLNALKHGFYSRQLTAADLADLAEIDDQFDLQDEAGLMRVYIRRLIERAGNPQDVQQAASLVRILCLASLTLNRLLRTRATLRFGANQDRLAVLDALSAFGVRMARLDKTLAEVRTCLEDDAENEGEPQQGGRSESAPPAIDEADGDFAAFLRRTQNE